jgi:hypothetical protein
MKTNDNAEEWAAQVKPFPQFPGHQREARDFYEICISTLLVIVNDTARVLMKQERELFHPIRREPER